MRKYISLLVIALSFGLTAHAETFENDGKYIVRVTPYKELWTSSEGVKETAKLAHTALTSVLASFERSGVFSESIVSKEDVERFRKSQDDLDSLVDYLNKFIAEQRERAAVLDLNAIPDAFMIYGGKKIQLSFGKSISGSVAVGLVIMPVKKEYIDRVTRQVVKTVYRPDFSIVAWPTGDIGFGIGGGVAARAGIGLIYNTNKTMVNVEQFYGAGPSISFNPPQLGAGITLKAGTLTNFELPGIINFVYFTASLEFGAIASSASGHVGITTILQAKDIAAMFNSSQQKAMQDAVKEIKGNVDSMVRQNREGSSKNGRVDEDEEKEKKEDKKNGKEKPVESQRP